jgi:hypothetical protein
MLLSIALFGELLCKRYFDVIQLFVDGGSCDSKNTGLSLLWSKPSDCY